ncbi:MAG: cytochrome d ubiquinol oxidase subunit II [Chitinophagaceae bacterium]|nr:cytochrome d ubiquinol oxidase subunit II [Chitinophagaceae bacterium]
MLYVVMIYLWASILLYILLGGADFGAGIIELFTSPKNRRKTRQAMYHAIGPVWEANHMWLIIAIVILFVGFPLIYTTMSVHLHIPLAIMLLGIIARGTAFAFRHYDAVIDDMQKVYNKIFVYSSFITPLFLGIIAGSAVSGRIDTEATTFADAYIFSWLNFFSLTTGLFTVAICGYLAAIYIIGETTDPTERSRFIKKARLSAMAAFVAGTLVFIAGYFESVPIFNWIFGNPVSLIAICAATASLFVQAQFLKRRKTNPIRILAGFQVTMILLAVTVKHYPNIVLLKDEKSLSLLEHAGHEQTIFYLGAALLIGSIFILPALYYLLYSFQRKTV